VAKAIDLTVAHGRASVMSLAREHGVESWMEHYFAKPAVDAPVDISKALGVLEQIKRTWGYDAFAFIKIRELVEHLKEAISDLNVNCFDVEELLVEAQNMQRAARACELLKVDRIRKAVRGRLLLLVAEEAERGIAVLKRQARQTRAPNKKNQEEAKKRRQAYQDEAEKVCKGNRTLKLSGSLHGVALSISNRLWDEAERDYKQIAAGRVSESAFEFARKSDRKTAQENCEWVRRKRDGLKLSTNADTIRKALQLPIKSPGRK
jgi:hypothetical protein